jgi:hypothetical protein
VTAFDPPNADPAEDAQTIPTPFEHLIDVAVYAPTALVLGALDELAHPAQVIERGRQLIKNAQFVGKLTVDMGRKTLVCEITRLRDRALEATIGDGDVDRDGDTEPEEGPWRPELRSVGREPPADLAIVDYEALTAAQVVRRLDGLNAEELTAVYQYELETRGRRTILHRCRQLLGEEDAPGPASWPA